MYSFRKNRRKCFGSLSLTVSRDAEARRSGRKPTSNIWSRKLWSSMPYTRSRKSTMGALWSGQKQADMSGSVTVPSEGQTHFRGKCFMLMSHCYQNIHRVNIVFVIFLFNLILLLVFQTTKVYSGGH